MDLSVREGKTYQFGPLRLDPKRRSILGFALLAAGLAVGVLIWRGHAPAARRMVAIGQFENLTHEPLFDRTFADATRIELLQSPYLSVLPEPRVCARNHGLAIVRGSLAQVGTRYLLTLTAEDCANGEVVAAEKGEVATRDGLLPALDSLASRLRQRLGERASSVQAFSVPVRRARTASFEALKAYSEAQDDIDRGDRADAIPLLQHAIALDPNFAAAHAALAVVLYNLKQPAEAEAQITLARRLMDGLDARERLMIATQYDIIVTHDADEEIRILKSWTTLYPNDAGAWADLADAQTWHGHAAAAIEPGRRAVALEPDVETAYVVLARAYLHAGKLAAARAVCDAAEANKVDGDDVHGVAYQIAFARRDLRAAAREMDWARGKPGERAMLVDAGQGAFSLGQLRRGQALFAQAMALGKPLGLGDFTAAPIARLLYDMGLADLARQSLALIPPGFDSADYRFSLAEFGDAAKAQALLQADLARSPADTLLTEVYAPEVRAALDLRAGRPADAVAALHPALPYEARTFDVTYLRGIAYLAARDGDAAAAEFQKILDNPGIEPVSVHYPLAQLGLARAQAQRGRTPLARRAYDAFFADWKDADPDMPLLRQANSEYARLPHLPRAQ
jgi:tetratricopeptide (TPR) repeat protein